MAEFFGSLLTCSFNLSKFSLSFVSPISMDPLMYADGPILYMTGCDASLLLIVVARSAGVSNWSGFHGYWFVCCEIQNWLIKIKPIVTKEEINIFMCK